MSRLDRFAGDIFVVPYCHPDWAWTHTRLWHAERYTLAFEEALAILREQDAAGLPDDDPTAFRWYVDVFVTELQPFLDRRPDLVPELRGWVERGRVAVCGGYANPRINHVEGETFVRSLVHGRRAFAALFPGADLSVHADLVDVAWGHPQLPQLLVQAGYAYYRGWRPHDALTAKGVPYHFRWTGLDGTEVLCSRGCYGGLCDPALVPPDFRDRWDEVKQLWGEHPLAALRDRVERSPADTLWLAQGADDNRPLRAIFGTDTRMDFEGFIAEWNDREPSRMRFGTPVDVFRHLEARRSDLPLLAGTIDPCDVGYNAAWNGANGLWWLRRVAARALLRAETLAVLAEPFGLVGPADELDRLWRDTLLVSCHATQWLFQADYDELMALARATVWQAERLTERVAAALAAQAHLPADTLSVVLNPLAYERTATVPLLLTFVRGEDGGVPADLRLVDGAGREVPFQITNESRHAGVRWEVEALARLTLPAGGWSTVRWARGGSASTATAAPTPRSADVTLANEHLRLELRQGRLTRVVDRASGRIDQAPPDLPFGHLCAGTVDTESPLHLGPFIGRHDAEWLDWSITSSGPVRSTFRARGRVGTHPATLEIRLPVGERRVELVATIDWQGMDGVLMFEWAPPLAGELWGGIPYGAERKDLEREPYVGIERLRPGAFYAQGFVDWSDGVRGLAYVPHNGDVYYVFDPRRRVVQHILINSLRRPDHNWEKDVNAGVEAEGRHSFTANLIWHDGDWRAAELWRQAESLTSAPLLVPRRRGGGPLPAHHSLLRLEPGNACLAALYHDGQAVLARLYETTGEPTIAQLTLPFPVDAAGPSTLLGESLPTDGSTAPAVGADGRRVSIPLRPWQVRTIALYPASGRGVGA